MYKFVHKNEIHIFKQELQSFSQVLGFLKLSFKELPNKFSLFYIDSEGDQIRLSNDEDIKALSQTKFQQKPKIYIQAPNEDGIFLLQSDALLDSVILDQNGFSTILRKEVDDTVEIKKKVILQEEEKKFSQQDSNRDLEQLKKHLEEFVIEQVQKEFQERKKRRKQKKEGGFKKGLENLLKKGAEIFNQNFEAPQPVFSQENKPKQNQNEIIHFGITCDGCQQPNFKGLRYKCSVCHDFDYCQTCEEKIEHNHPFLKIKNPSEAPSQIIVAFEEQSPVFNNNFCQRNGRDQQVSKEKSLEKKEKQKEKQAKSKEKKLRQESLKKKQAEQNCATQQKYKVNLNPNQQYTWTVQNQAKQIAEFMGGNQEQYLEVCALNPDKKLDDIVFIVLNQQQKKFENQIKATTQTQTEVPSQKETTQKIEIKKTQNYENTQTLDNTEVKKNQKVENQQTHFSKDVQNLYSHEVIQKAKKISEVLSGNSNNYLEFVNQNQEKNLDQLIAMIFEEQI